MSSGLFKNFYDQYWSGRKEKSDRYRYKIFLSWIKPGTKVLDVGCGDGYLGALLKEKNHCDVTCLDISEPALKMAKERGLKTVMADIQDSLPFQDGSFDYVIATEVVEHIPFSEALLEEIKRVSRKYLIISIPNIAFWKYRLQLLQGRFPKQWVLQPFEHLHFWSVSDFKDMLGSLSIDIEEIKAGSGRRYIRDIWPNLFASQVCFKLRKK